MRGTKKGNPGQETRTHARRKSTRAAVPWEWIVGHDRGSLSNPFGGLESLSS